jgi:hypothetical protein
MEAFSPDQWLVLALAFLFGLILGMALMASPKWKRRYREEIARREASEAEIAQLRRDAAEADTLHRAALREPGRRPEVEPEETRPL